MQTPKTNLYPHMSIFCLFFYDSHLQQRPSLLHQLLSLQRKLKLHHQPRLLLHPRPYHPRLYHPLRSHQQTYSHSNNNNNNKHHPYPTVTYSQRPRLNAKKLPIVNTLLIIKGMEYVKHFKSRLTIVTS